MQNLKLEKAATRSHSEISASGCEMLRDAASGCEWLFLLRVAASFWLPLCCFLLLPFGFAIPFGFLSAGGKPGPSELPGAGSGPSPPGSAARGIAGPGAAAVLFRQGEEDMFFFFGDIPNGFRFSGWFPGKTNKQTRGTLKKGQTHMDDHVPAKVNGSVHAPATSAHGYVEILQHRCKLEGQTRTMQPGPSNSGKFLSRIGHTKQITSQHLPTCQ